MKVKLLVPRSGPKGAENAGDIVDVDQKTAKRMFETVPPQAVPVTPPKAAETRAKGSAD